MRSIRDIAGNSVDEVGQWSDNRGFTILIN